MSIQALAEFDSRVGVYEAFRQYLESLLPQLIGNAGIRPHKIETRTKSRLSVEEKLRRPGKSYTNLSDMTDVCGARIITYFATDVDSIGSIIEREFAVDRGNSVGKRVYTDPDRFGYASLHYVVSLTEQRLKLTECAPWGECKAEIQVRTIIQHAWAEIEHDLGFKSSTAVPRKIKRRFSRLAALLEMADDEFAGVTRDLGSYVKHVSQQLENAQTLIEIDGASVSELVKSDPLVVECDDSISQQSSRPFRSSDEISASLLASELRFVGIDTVDTLRKTINANKGKIVEVAARRLSGQDRSAISRGISLLYTCYAVLAATNSIDAFMKFFGRHNFGPQDALRQHAAELIAAYRSPRDAPG